jgi:hypothetical protein
MKIKHDSGENPEYYFAREKADLMCRHAIHTIERMKRRASDPARSLDELLVLHKMLEPFTLTL